MKILVCTNALSIMNGSIYHRIYNPFKDLQELGMNIDFCADFLSQSFSELLKYDVIVVSRTITYNPILHSNAMDMWHKLPSSTKLVVDLDDYWVVPNSHPNAYWWSKHDTSNCIIDTLRLASEVWTTNNNLKKKIGRISEKVTVIPNGIKFKPITKSKSHTIRVGIMVNNTHEMNLELLSSGLKKLDINKYELILVGADKSRRSNVNSLLDIENTQLRYKHIVWKKAIGYEGVYENIDVLLCPLAANNFNKFRSRLKLEEAASFQFKVVASNYGGYFGQEQEGVIITNNFNNLDNYLSDLENQNHPKNVDGWSALQQLRIDRMNDLAYNN